MSGNEWKLPLNIAIGFHLLIALAIVFLPQLLMPTSRIEELYTVNLVSISEMAPAQETPAKAEPAAKPEPPSQPPPKQAEPVQPPPPKPIAPETPKKVVEKIALQEPEIVEPTPVTPPAPAEAISIKPLKRKVKADIPPEPPPVPKKNEQDLSKLQRQKLAEILRAEQKAAEEARILAEEAELEKRLAEAALNRMKAASARQAVTQAEQASGQTGTPDRPSALENQYYSSVAARIQPFWSLPEYRQWDPNLLAIVIITVQKDGRITGHYFEQSSGDAEFDKYVTKTLQDVGTLPPIPAAIRKDRLEFGLRFSPGGVR